LYCEDDQNPGLPVKRRVRCLKLSYSNRTNLLYLYDFYSALMADSYQPTYLLSIFLILVYALWHGRAQL